MRFSSFYALLLLFFLTYVGADSAYATIVVSNKEPSVEEIRKAEAGDANLQSELGLRILRNAQFKANSSYILAERWLRKAAEKNNAPAQAALGTLYFEGHGLSKDYTKAAEWWLRSVESGLTTQDGLPTIAWRLGRLYYEGYGVDQNYEEAAKWFQKGNAGPWSQYDLGKLYLEGRGVPQNDEKAYYFLRSASLWPINVSTKPLEKAASNLTKQQKEDLDKQAQANAPKVVP